MNQKIGDEQIVINPSFIRFHLEHLKNLEKHVSPTSHLAISQLQQSYISLSYKDLSVGIKDVLKRDKIARELGKPSPMVHISRPSIRQ